MDVGKIQNVSTRQIGSPLYGAHAAGVLELTVWDAFEFDEDGGLLQLEDETLAYTGWVEDESDPTLPDTITLAAPTTVGHDEGVPVTVLPASTITVATVVIDEEGEALEPVVVPQALVPTLADGIRGDNGETVTVEEVDGQWQIVSVDKDAVTIDGAKIDPDSTIPPAALTDGLPPATAPTLEAFAATDFIAIRVGLVDNADPTQVRVYASTSATGPFATVVGVIENGGAGVVRAIGGTPLAQGVDYYLQAEAFDADGTGPASAVVGPVRLSKIDRTQIGEHEIQTVHLAADVITADLLVANNALIEALQVTDLSAINLTGVNIVGGSATFAEGQTGSYVEDWSSLDNPSLPVGDPPAQWSVVKVNPDSGNGLRFISTRQAGESQALLRAIQAGRPAGSPRTFDIATLSDPSIPDMVQDAVVTFDFQEKGGTNTTGGLTTSLLLRQPNSTPLLPGVDALEVSYTIGSGWRIYADLDQVGAVGTRLNYQISRNTWYTIEVTLRGSAIQFRAKPRGAASWAFVWSNIISTLVPASGRIAIASEFSSVSASPTVTEIDNLTFVALEQGMQIDPDGSTRVSSIEIGNGRVLQSLVVPDPIMPTDAVTKRYVDMSQQANFSSWQSSTSIYVDNNQTTYPILGPTAEADTGAWTRSFTPVNFNDGWRCAVAGVYAITVSITWPANAAGRRTLAWDNGDAGVVGAERADSAPGASITLGQQIVVEKRFAVGDFFCPRLFQTSGSTLECSKYRVTFDRRGA